MATLSPLMDATLMDAARFTSPHTARSLPTFGCFQAGCVRP